MSASRELIIPDIGDFKNIPVIEVFVKPGDIVSKDAPLVTLESEKATLDVPSDFAGTIQELRIKVGDRVSQGTVIAILQTDANPQPASSEPPTPAGTAAQTSPTKQADSAAKAQQSPSSEPAVLQQSQELREIVVPDIGEFKDVPIIEIFVKSGDTFDKDSPLLTLESEKATLDIPAPFAGTMGEVLVKVGDRVSAGTVVAKVQTGAGAVLPKPSVSAASTASVPSNGTKSSAPVNNAPHGTSAGIGTNGHAANGSANGATLGLPGGVITGPVHASPSIRRFARELGVTLGHVRGTGPNGRITRVDVQNWVKRALHAPSVAGQNGGQSSSGGMAVLPWPKVDFAAFGPIERVPLSRIKKLSGPNLHRNWVMIPHVTQHDEADITDLEAMRKAINAEKNVKVTMLAFLIVASVATLKRFPEVNASLEGDDLIKKGYYHIGFAADTPNGLLVPVIRDADRKGILEIAEETAALAKKARDGKLSGTEMQGGTFTISSLGGIGGTAFTPIINAPEVAILGVSRSSMKPVWDGQAFQPRLILPLSLSYDHRVIDGAGAARFCVALAQTLADLRRALL